MEDRKVKESKKKEDVQVVQVQVDKQNPYLYYPTDLIIICSVASLKINAQDHADQEIFLNFFASLRNRFINVPSYAPYRAHQISDMSNKSMLGLY